MLSLRLQSELANQRGEIKIKHESRSRIETNGKKLGRSHLATLLKSQQRDLIERPLSERIMALFCGNNEVSHTLEYSNIRQDL